MEKTVYKSVDEMPILMGVEDIVATGICGKNKAYDFFHIKGFPYLQIGNRKQGIVLSLKRIVLRRGYFSRIRCRLSLAARCKGYSF